MKALDSIQKIIPPEPRKSLAKPLTQNGIEAAIENLAKGKAPGSDGLTIDFYKTNPGSICPTTVSIIYPNIQRIIPPSHNRSFNYVPITQKKNDIKKLQTIKPNKS